MSKEMQSSLFEGFGLFDGLGGDQTAVSEENAILSSGKDKKTGKKSAKTVKSSSKSAPKPKKLEAPVTVIGCGWKYVYDGNGEVAALDVLKAAYAAGYTEVALAKVYTGSDPSLLYVNVFEAAASGDDKAVAFKDGKIEVVIGMNRAEYAVSDFEGMEEADISVLDLTEKYEESHPEFEGASLHAECGLAIPLIEESRKVPESTSVKVWQDGGITEMSAEDFRLAYEVSDEKVKMKLYKSDSGTVFVGYTGDPVVVHMTDFGVEKAVTETVVEKYRLPFTICLANFNKNFSVTEAHFGGKTSVTQEEVLDVLKRNYKMFGQKDRKVDWIYDKKQNILSVAVISGKKGSAAVIPFPMLYEVEDGMRIERTGIGNFYGEIGVNGDISRIRFEMSLPRIPVALLYDIVREFRKDLGREKIAIIRYNKLTKHYRIVFPRQKATKTAVVYEHVPFSLCEMDVIHIHSHNTMRADWSAVDDEDETGIGLFGVIGRLHSVPQIALRAGMNGVFTDMHVSDIFQTGGKAA